MVFGIQGRGRWRHGVLRGSASGDIDSPPYAVDDANGEGEGGEQCFRDDGSVDHEEK